MMLTVVILTFLKSTREPMVPGPFHFNKYPPIRSKWCHVPLLRSGIHMKMGRFLGNPVCTCTWPNSQFPATSDFWSCHVFLHFYLALLKKLQFSWISRCLHHIHVKCRTLNIQHFSIRQWMKNATGPKLKVDENWFYCQGFRLHSHYTLEGVVKIGLCPK